MPEIASSRTWAEINLNHLEHNYNHLRNIVPKSCRLMGVVKANAYGHGITQIGAKLEVLGADMLAVACLDEAIDLRCSGVSLPILCLGQTSPALTNLLLDYDITQAISNFATASAMADTARAKGTRLTVHIKLNTGMNRLGFVWDKEANEISRGEILRICTLPSLRIEGLFTHFCNAEADDRFTRLQYECFCDAKQTLAKSGVFFELYHCAASAAILNHPYSYMDMVRPGISLYGYPGTPFENAFRPVMTLKSRVALISSISAGACIGYGCTATLKRDTRLAVLPIGYADGFSRCFSNGFQVLIDGERFPVVGRVCMDMCMIDVTDTPSIEVGSVATIYGSFQMMTQAQEYAGTIPNELLCRITARVPRIYN